MQRNKFNTASKATLAVSGLITLGLLLGGCKGIPTQGERSARKETRAVEQVFRPDGQRPALPELTTHSALGDFLRYAMLNQPQVEAAYFDWRAAVERITVERSLPDPRLTFKTDIADIVMSLMPGLMVDIPGPGKLKGAANVATAESQGRYFQFESSVLQTAFAVKKAYYQLYFLEDRIRVNQQTLGLLTEVEKLARAQNGVGKGTLQDVLRAQIEQERLTTEIANLADSRHALLEQFKAALGLTVDQDAPPVPTQFESTSLDLTSDQLLATALARNPRLKAMEAEVHRAEASLRLAYKARVPDFSLGIEVDVKASPTIFTPQAGVTLPIWRDKIAAQIAGAQAMKSAAKARLTAEQIMLAVDFAEKSFMYREANRNVQLLQDSLLSKARQSLEVGRAGYTAGNVEFINFIDAERTLLEFQLQEVAARTQRELALAEISLLIVGVAPTGAPVLHPAQANSTPTRPSKK